MRIFVLWVGIGVFVLMGLFPPWNYVCVRRPPVPIVAEYISIKSAGYHFLLKPPSHIISDNTSKQKRLSIDGQTVSEVRLNNQRLLLQYIIILPILVLGAVMLRKKR